MNAIRRDPRLVATTKTPAQTGGSLSPRNPHLPAAKKNPPTERFEAPQKQLVTLKPAVENQQGAGPHFKVVGGVLRQTIDGNLVRTIMPVRRDPADA